MFEGLFSSVEGIVSTFGPPGVFLAMFIETIFPPIPSEVVMPLAGSIAFFGGQGIVGLIWMILAGTLGATLGAVLIYYIALVGGRPMVLKYGKRFMLDDKKLSIVEKWFEKHGGHAVFLCRMAPGLRELISVPAGLAKMNFWRFIIPTFFGSLIWTAFLGSIGYFLAETWEDLSVGEYSLKNILNVVAVILATLITVFLILRHVNKFNGEKKKRK